MRNDGVLWIISPAQIIKEINSADGRFNNLCASMVLTPEYRYLIYYVIPYQAVENMLYQSKKESILLSSSQTVVLTLIKDTNGDGMGYYCNNCRNEPKFW